jgi:hypothetical protein
LLCGFFDRLALQIAENDWKPVVFGQAVQFLIQQGLQITPLVLLGSFGCGQLRHLLLSASPLRRHGFRFHGRAEGDTVQPVGNLLPRPDGRRFAGEDQKGRLKGVLGIVMIADDTTADAEDHWAVTTDKGFKGRFVLLVDEGRQQLPIRPPRSILPRHGPAKMPDHHVHSSLRHSCPPRPVATDLYPLLPGESQFYSLFYGGGGFGPLGWCANRTPVNSADGGAARRS